MTSADAADEEARDRRLQPARDPPGREAVHESVEVVDVEQADRAAGQTDQRVPAELGRVVEAEAGLDAEDRAEAFDRAEDGVGDDRRDERRDEHLRLDVVAVEELRTEDGSAERRPEDRPDTGRHPDRDRDPRIARVEVEQAPEEGPEPGADLGGRALAPAGPARSDRDRRMRPA